MGLFGSRAASTATSTVNGRILRALEHARDRRMTGRILVSDTELDHTAEIFTFEGDVYAATISGFDPWVSARLAAGGRLSAEQCSALDATPDAGGPSRSGALAVAQDWVTPEVLASVHQEFTVATFGAVVCAEHARVHTDEGVTTDRLCATPLPLDALLATIEPRATRLAADEAAVTGDAFASAVVQRTSVQPPAALALPEIGALLEVLDGTRPVDVVAASLGFTRAEIAHLLAALTASGTVVAVGQAADADRWLVPEQFGRRRFQPRVAVEVSPPEPVALAEPTALAEPAEPAEPPEPVMPPEPDLPPGPDLPPEPEFPPEAAAEPASAPDDEPPPDDFATAALRAELAAAEHWAAELRARLEQQRRHES